MYAHILIPTDGSSLAARGARAGVQLAKALGAKCWRTPGSRSSSSA